MRNRTFARMGFISKTMDGSPLLTRIRSLVIHSGQELGNAIRKAYRFGHTGLQCSVSNYFRVKYVEIERRDANLAQFGDLQAVGNLA